MLTKKQKEHKDLINAIKALEVSVSKKLKENQYCLEAKE